MPRSEPWLLLLAVAAACGDDGADEHSTCPDGQVPCDGVCIAAIEASASAVHERVFLHSCALSASCHQGSGAMEGLHLDSLDGVFASAVAAPSRQEPELSIIEPGRPEDSYLVRKLHGEDIAATSSTGSATTIMPPPPSDPLCQAKLEAVSAWITAGAARP